jgi:flagellar hook protein FlgE
MSILGALYSAVSGLTASSNALGIISDNISNSNTVGYKETSTNFSTLVTQSSGATTLYSPGGVTSAPFYNVDQQGVMQSTNSPTDIALSGHGFFVVNVSPGGASSGGAFSFTRAGNFTVNATGNLVNGAGLYLQGQKLTPAQALAIANGNTQQLTATSLNSLQTINVTGIGGTASSTANVTLSANLPASDTPASSARTMTVPIFDSQGNEHDMTLSFSRVAQVASSQDFAESNAIAQGDKFTVALDGQTFNTAPLTQAAPALSDIANSINGQFNAALVKVGGGAPQAGDVFTATVNGTAFTTAPIAGAGPFTANDVVNSLNAKLSAVDIPVTVGAPNAADTLSINVNGTVFTTAALGGGATINTMATRIQAAIPANFTASVVGGNIEITDKTGALWKAGPITVTGTGTETFGAGVQTSTFTAAFNATTGNISIANSTGTATTASIVLAAGTGTETFAPQATSNTFAASVVGGNLRITDAAGQPVTGGAVTASTGAETFAGALPVNGVPTNRWTVAAGFPSSGTTTATILPGDNIVQFNSDGTLNLPQSTFATTKSLSITWDPSFSGGASPQNLTFNIGTNGQTNGLSQLGTTFSVGTINQDGVKFGNFTGVTIDANGIVTANFNNGLHQAIDILPIATFANPDGLLPVTGDTYAQSAASGSVLLNQAGTGSAGTVAPSSLENSTVDIATEFSKLIITQNAYQANSKVITVSNQMLQALLAIQTG